MADQRTHSGARVLTIWHSTRTNEELVELLEANGVGRLIDVRTVPRSRRNPQFNADTLPERLDERGIGYLYLPDPLSIDHTFLQSPQTTDCQWDG